MSKVNISSLVKKGKIRVVNLPLKAKEIKENQLLLLRDDIDDTGTLLRKDKFRGAFIHAFDALERAIDIFLIHNRYKTSDRFCRKVAIGELLGKGFLEEYEELFELRKEGMYDRYGAIQESDVEKVLKVTIPMILKKAGVKD